MTSLAPHLSHDLFPVLMLPVLLWSLLASTARRRPGIGWVRGLPWAVAAGVFTSAMALLALPGGTLWLSGESPASVAWLPAGRLIELVVGFGLAAATFSWPLAAMLRQAGRR